MVLSLCNSRREPIMEIHNIKALNRDISFAAVDELHFDIPYYRTDRQGKKVKNELFDLAKEDLFILLNDEQYFVIRDCSIKKDSKKEAIKSVEAFSYEYTLSNKIVEDYNLTARLLWDVHNNKDGNGYYQGFLNYVTSRTNWKVDYVSPKVLNKRRELKFTNRSILDCIYDCSDTYNCVFMFDTIEKKISAYDISEIGGNQGIVISDHNFIESLTEKISTDDLKTRLYIYGEDGLSIHSRNMSGLSYLDNMSFYKDFGYFSDDLMEALEKHEKAVKEAEPKFRDLLERMDKYDVILNLLETSRRDYVMQYKKELQMIDSAITAAAYGEEPLPIKPHREKADAMKAKIDSTDAEIKKEKANLDGVVKELNLFSEKIKEDNFFTDEQLEEYNEFIKEDAQSDNSFVRGMEDDLMEYGKEILEKISYPTISFDIDLEGFKRISNFKNPLSRLKIGDFVNIEDEELGIDVELRVISMDLDYDDHSVSIEFGNKYKVDSSEMYLSELLNDIKSITNSVSINDFYWNRGIERYSAINDYLDKNLSLAKQAIVTGSNQKPILDDRGLWLFKENDDGTIDNKQIRAVNNVLALTNDNWDTVTTAISGDGINAEAITGRLGNFVTINANQIKVDSQGLAEDSDLNKIFKNETEKITHDLSKYTADVGNNLDVLKGKISSVESGVKDVEANAVLKEKFYNRVKITPQSGIQVIDNYNRERVKIGQLGSNRYGIKILDSEGKRTLLDDRGMLQTWQDSISGNVDHSTGINLNFFLPNTIKLFYNVVVYVKNEAYRGFQTIVEGGEHVGSTTSGGVADITSRTHNATNVMPDIDGGHDHGIEPYDRIPVNINWGGPPYIPTSLPTAKGWRYSGAHTHEFTIGDNGHVHKFYVPPHSHPTSNNIREYSSSSVNVSLNGYGLGSVSGYSNNSFTVVSPYSYESGVERVSTLNNGSWNSIRISGGQGYVTATVFVQCFINL